MLYESVITAPTRKRLGEYYTPDWLAERMVSTTVDRPLETRVLDPACGSGIFLFHAARRYLSEAERVGMSLESALSGLTRHVLGMDLHPVAVTLARVTYLLAIGRERLTLVRAVERYLRIGGRFSFVMPNAAVDRGQFHGLRSGSYKRPDSQHPIAIAFDPALDLRRIRPRFFPRGAAVLRGTPAKKPKPLPTEIEVWSGRVPEQNANWDAVESRLSQSPRKARPASNEPTSPWSDRFLQGATIVPRLLFFVTRQAAGPLGRAAGKAGVRSLHRNNDKKPWKDLPALEGVVETEFIRPVLLGESVIPFRVAETFEAVLPGNGIGSRTANLTDSTLTKA